MKSKLILLLLAIAGTVLAKENVGSRQPQAPSAQMKSITAGCLPSTAKTELAFNNVKTVILINGDMWWDAMASIGPQYEIPNGSGKHSLFSGALWIGGVDASNNLKVAAQTYRQGGSDFWPGPLDTTSASVGPDVCLQYDRHWKLTLQQIIDFKAYSEQTNPPAGYSDASIPEAIKSWPGTGDFNGEHQTRYLAPYVDVDSDGVYNYQAGDYPNHNQLYSTIQCVGDLLYGDEVIWWVFNDVGNIHTETGGAPIGLEIQAQAFAFATNDEVNNMTFYNYKIINRSSTGINNNYFGVFVDADLGNYLDDYVGCDVPRGLGYCYNGDADDDGPSGYGTNPPAVGVDFFQGPVADANDGIDNNRDCITDEPGELIIMSRFVYYDNENSPPNGNPFTASDYYNFLRGIWKNGVPMTYGGDGIGGGNGATTIPCKFMFPGDTDHQWEWGTGGDCFSNSPGASQASWDEYIAGNVKNDRRFLHSAGPFTLQAGAVNKITTGAVWARATQGGPQASVNILRIVDDKAQALFDNCFSILNGPDAPDVTIREMDKEVILTISNSPSSNNYKEGYSEKDPYIHLSVDTLYRFQGYQIYQLKDETVSSSELHNPDRARLVAQIDTKDSIAQVVNHYFDFSTSTYTAVAEVNGDNKGIRHSFRILTDKFATGDNRLINHKNYFYMAIAYGFNYTEMTEDPYTLQDGRAQPYIAGRRNVKVYTGIPHIPSPENYGQQLNSIYGNGPKLTRVEGNGNGYLINYHTPDVNASDLSTIRLTLDITSETVAEILDVNTGYRSKHPEYEAGRGPVNVKVLDPVKVPNASFVLWLENIDDTAKWYLHNLNTDETLTADARYSTLYEQLFPEWGLSVTLSKIQGPLLRWDGTEDAHGFVEATMEFSDPNKFWLIGVPDGDGTGDEIDSAFNWVHPPDTGSVNGIDPQNKYGKVLGGIWAPYRLVNGWKHGAGGVGYPLVVTVIKQNLAQNLNSVDVVITRDKSKWSRCVVLESDNSPSLTQGFTPKFFPRKTFSINKEGVYATDSLFNEPNDQNSPNYISGKGMGWFPGYAIDVEKGERLNIMFAEDSWLAGENGKDMKWNPSSNFIGEFGEIQLGGKHFVYIVNSNTDSTELNRMPGYDGCATIRNLFNTPLAIDKTRIFKNVSWVNFPVTVEGYSFENGMVPPCDVKIRLRVARPYTSYGTGTPVDSVSLVANTTYVVYSGRVNYNGTNYIAGQTFTTLSTPLTYSVTTSNASTPTAIVLASGGNNGYPMYTFNTDGLANKPYNVDVAKSALDLINVVPNPYYAYSAYEGTVVAGVAVQPQLDNRVKIVNLPPRCTISIYTVNGILVRRFNRDVAADNSSGSDLDDKNFETSQDWDIKNHKNVPIASGLYLIHVEAKDASGNVIGERTLKWFGVMRPIDLDSF